MLRNKTAYRVDSELGRLEFATYRVEEAQGRVCYDTARQHFAALHAKQYYLTRGFREVALVYGVVESSYRKTAAWLNRIRCQEQEGTRPRTLHEVAEAEGGAIEQALAERTAQSLPQGAETAEPSRPSAPMDGRCVAAAQRRVLQAAGLSEAEQQKVRQNPVPYEERARSVAVSIDEVGVKQQASTRRRGSEAARRAPKGRPRVQTAVAQIESGGGRYACSAQGVEVVLRRVLAYVQANHLQAGSLVVFLDGQRSLHAAVRLRLASTGRLQVILDWYHLQKKCAEELSRALTGRQIRNEVLGQLTRWLWYGLVEEAMACLRAVDAQKIKNAAVLQTLIASLEHNRGIIPCYAVRKELGLKNSSNVGEKYNDLIVSMRQKHNGMSWSAEGSGALAALSTLIVNNEHEQWFRTRTLRFAPAA